jgi:hypothetical protein
MPTTWPRKLLMVALLSTGGFAGSGIGELVVAAVHMLMR